MYTMSFNPRKTLLGQLHYPVISLAGYLYTMHSVNSQSPTHSVRTSLWYLKLLNFDLALLSANSLNQLLIET